MDWNDPAQRASLLERIGAAAYNKAFKAHRDETAMTVNGRRIFPVNSARFGALFMIEGTSWAYATLDEAKTYAASLPAMEA